MRVVIAGGSGFLGQALTRQLAKGGHQVVLLTRGPDAAGAGGPVRRAAWTPDGRTGPWAADIDGADAVVNLAGASIADRRWSPARKQVLHDSRADSTRSLAAAIRAVHIKPGVFIQGSAVGFYGAYDTDETFDESSGPGADFLATLAVAWEAEAHPIATLTRLVFVRTGIVLAKHGGALAKMATPFKFFVGGPIGGGRQMMSWVHLDDWVSLVIWAITTPAVDGPINAAAPHPVTNDEFSRALGRALHRPSWMPAPGFALKLAFGEMATDMLLRGQRVVPRRALELGYRFRFERIDEAMAAAVR
jgi:uncharacterized protein (TIGR01777 family)